MCLDSEDSNMTAVAQSGREDSEDSTEKVIPATALTQAAAFEEGDVLKTITLAQIEVEARQLQGTLGEVYAKVPFVDIWQLSRIPPPDNVRGLTDNEKGILACVTYDLDDEEILANETHKRNV